MSDLRSLDRSAKMDLSAKRLTYRTCCMEVSLRRYQGFLQVFIDKRQVAAFGLEQVRQILNGGGKDNG